jgi:Carboxypeptidase regulatory-like domain/TonB dependent receptor
MNRWLALVIAPFVLAAYGFAQNATGTIEGLVSDASGSAVVGATVTVENIATNVKLTTPTNAAGRFYVRYLAPGTYSVTVEQIGFEKYIQTNILLDIEQTISLTIPLKVGDVKTFIEVDANTAQLATESSTVATTISAKGVLDLPLQGRNPYSLVTLVPGVNAGNGGSTPWISGGRNDYNDVTIDGTSVIVPENNISHLQIGYQPIEDSVSEVSVVTNNLAPEYGRTGGGTINVSTRGGTNQLHFTLFEFNRNRIFNANSYANIKAGLPTNAVHYNQFGFTVGGPVVLPHIYNGKSKTFFFVDYQGTRQPGAVTDTTSVPTAAMRQGIFTGLTNGSTGSGGAPVTIYNPFSVSADPSCPATQPTCLRAPFPNNVIPQSMINPTAALWMTYFPAANSPSTVTNTALQTNNWHTQGANTSPNDQIDARIDQNFSERFRMFVRGSNQTGFSSDFNGFGNPATSQGTGPTHYYNRNITLNGIYTLSPTMILNLNYGFARDYSIRLPFSQGACPSTIGLPASLDAIVQNCEFPQVSISGNNAGYTLGQASFTTLYDFPYSHIFRGDVTKILSKHTLKMGATWEKMFVNFTQLGDPDGQFSFSSSFTQQNASAGTSTTQGNGLATMLLGLPSNNSGDISFTFSGATASTYTGLYFQDDWKVTSKLTVNLGIRYDLDTPRTERYNRLAYFNPNLPSTLQGQVQSSALCPNCGNLMGQFQFAGLPNSLYGRHQTPTDTNNFAPRVGFAYNLFKDTVIRGGYGILYAPSMQQAGGTSGSIGTDGFTGSSALNTTFDNGTTFAASLSNPFPSGVTLPQGSKNGPISGNNVDLGGGVGSYFIAYMNPVVQQWNFNIQQQVKGNWLIQVGYLGSKGQHLPDGESSFTYNQLPASYLKLGSGLIAKVPNPFYGLIQNPTSIYAQPTIQANYLLDAYPQYQSVNAFRVPEANSNYQSFIVSAQHRYRSGLTLLISFTGAKLLDDASQVVSYEGAAGLKQDFYCYKCDKSISSQDVPRRLVTSATYEIPVGKGRHFFGGMSRGLDAIFGGWQINGIMTFAKGLPIQLSNGGNTTGLNSPGIWATENGQNPELGGDIKNRLNEYFVQSVFSQTPNYAFGNTGRFLPNVRAPGVHNLDASLFKSFKPIERMTIQLRAEAYNFTNSPTWASPGTTVNNVSTFGIVTSRSGNRTMQMAIKLIF